MTPTKLVVQQRIRTQDVLLDIAAQDRHIDAWVAWAEWEACRTGRTTFDILSSREIGWDEWPPSHERRNAPADPLGP